MASVKVKKPEMKKKSIKELVNDIPPSFHVKGFSIVEEISLGDYSFGYGNCFAEPRRTIRFKVLLHSLNCESGVWYFNSYEQAQEFIKVYCIKHNIKLGDFLYER